MRKWHKKIMPSDSMNAESLHIGLGVSLWRLDRLRDGFQQEG